MTFSFKNRSGLLLFVVFVLVEGPLISGLSFPGRGPRLSESFSRRQSIFPQEAKLKNPAKSARENTFFEPKNRRSGPLYVSNAVPVSEDDDSSSKIEKSKVASASFNLVKTTIGSGVLALPSGLACMTNDPAMLPSAMALMAVLGVLSTYTFALYGRLIHKTQARSLGELWESISGKGSSWIVGLCSLVFGLGATLSYSILVCDVFQTLATALGGSGLLITKPFWVLVMTLGAIIPLCSMKDLNKLAPVSAVGVTGIMSTSLFLAWRCPFINPQSPYAAGGALLSTLTASQLPAFGTIAKGFGSPSSMVLGGMAASAYLGHFAAPDFYHAVKRTDSSSEGSESRSVKTMRDFFKVTIASFSTVIFINCLMMAFGFLTFGGNSDGIILNNFSAMDPFATVCRLLMSISVLGGYPFIISACRGEASELYKRKTKKEATPSVQKKINLSMLAGIASLALVLKSAGFVIGFNGALMGSAIVYIFPCLLFLSATSEVAPRSRRLSFERLFCKFLVGFGVFASATGAVVSVLDQYFPSLLV